jgi:hypothetical protein
LAGMGPLRQPTRSRVDLAKRSRLTYGLTCNDEQRFRGQRWSRTTPSRRRLTYGGDENVLVSYNDIEAEEIAGEY